MNRVLIISHDIVGRQMAGPGIRCLELARVLARQVEVSLAIPNVPDIEGAGVPLHPYRLGDWASLEGATTGVQAILLNPYSLDTFPTLATLGVPLVVDLYDPFPLEGLYIHAHGPMAERLAHHQHAHRLANRACQVGDFFLCAHERQRDWWLGLLQANGRVNPLTVEADPTLRGLIDEVSFGLPASPLPEGKGPRTSLPYLEPEDRLILWGGGIWNWLDPLTLIRAMPAVLEQEPRARLLFPGTRHPNHEHVPDMEMRHRALELARQLGLLDRQIFFGDWVPHEQWSGYLADADVAVSLHLDSPETRFAAIRSRLLGHIWARTPLVVSEGDVGSELVERYRLGEVVGYGDVPATARALLGVLAAGKGAYRDRLEEVSQCFTWERVAAPLIRFCLAPRLAADRQAGIQVGESPPQERVDPEEIVRLRQLVEAYERGRFIQAMRRLARLKQQIWGDR